MITILNFAINELRDSAIITGIVAGVDSSVITVNENKFAANDWVSISGSGSYDTNSIRISEISGNNITVPITGDITTFGNIMALSPVLEIGTQKHIRDLRNENNSQKYPFIFIPENNVEYAYIKVSSNSGFTKLGKTGSVNNIFVLDCSDNNESNSTLREIALRMEALFLSFIEKIQGQSNVMAVTYDSIKIHIRFGTGSQYGYTKLNFNEKLTGIGVSGLQISYYDNNTECN